VSLRPLEGSGFEWLQPRFQGWTGSATAARLAATALEDSTREGYGRHFALFSEWCAENELEPCPATPAMITCYVGWLAERGTIAASSLQPYLSAINSYHADRGYERPALGHLLSRARQGMARGQALISTRDTRVPLPPEAAGTILARTLALLEQRRSELGRLAFAQWLRRRFAILLTYAFLGRQDSSVHLQAEDFGVDDLALWLRISEKQKRGMALRRVIRLPLRAAPCRGHQSAIPALAQLGRAYLDARAAVVGGAPAPRWLFQLPGEPAPSSTHMAAWLATTLSDEGIAAPPGFAYLGHSLRSGASSGCEAIGVSRFRGNWAGGWSQSGRTRELHYIDPSILPSPAAYAFFGWLLDSAYELAEPQWERAPRAVAREDPGEAPDAARRAAFGGDA